MHSVMYEKLEVNRDIRFGKSSIAHFARCLSVLDKGQNTQKAKKQQEGLAQRWAVQVDDRDSGEAGDDWAEDSAAFFPAR
jgi:hypothetical protein